MKRRLPALLTCFCLVLSGCGPVQAPQPSPTAAPAPTAAPTPVGRREFALPLDTTGGWDPYGGSRSSNMALLPLLCESLYVLDEHFEAKPLLAASAQASEDGLVWTVRLRRGVTFSNGQALDAQTVRDAVLAAKGEKSLYAARLAGVKKVTAEEKGALTFQLDAPNARFPALLDFPIALVEPDGVYGTGAYVLAGEALVAREDWWQGLELPAKTIPLSPVSDADDLIAQFNAGALSVVAADPTGADTLGYSGSYQDWEYATSTMLYLGFHCGKGPCKSAEFRRAVSLCLDRDALVTQGLDRHGLAAALPAPPVSSRYDKTLAAQAGADPAQAAQLLDGLGYKLGEDGLRLAGRKPLELTFLVNSDNRHKERLAKAVTAALESAGIRVTVRALPWEDYRKALVRGDFDLYLAECRLTGDLDPGVLITPGSGLYYGAFRSKELTAALDRARLTGDWKDFDAQWLADVPLAVLCFKNASMLTQWGQVSGARPTQGNLFNALENWKIS